MAEVVREQIKSISKAKTVLSSQFRYVFEYFESKEDRFRRKQDDHQNAFSMCRESEAADERNTVQQYLANVDGHSSMENYVAETDVCQVCHKETHSGRA